MTALGDRSLGGCSLGCSLGGRQVKLLADAVLGFTRSQPGALLDHMAAMCRKTAGKEAADTEGEGNAAWRADLEAAAGLYDNASAHLADSGPGSSGGAEALAAADVHALTFCQTWMDGRLKGEDSARFSVMCPHFQTTVTFGPGAVKHFDAEALRAHARLSARMVDRMRAGYDRAFMFVGDAFAAPGSGGLAGVLAAGAGGGGGGGGAAEDARASP